MEISQRVIDGRVASYSKIRSASGVVTEASLLYEFAWDECYEKGHFTEGEFAKLVSIEFRVAFARLRQLFSHADMMGFEELVENHLTVQHGMCGMVDDFGYRPWRFAA